MAHSDGQRLHDTVVVLPVVFVARKYVLIQVEHVLAAEQVLQLVTPHETQAPEDTKNPALQTEQPALVQVAQFVPQAVHVADVVPEAAV